VRVILNAKNTEPLRWEVTWNAPGAEARRPADLKAAGKE
jgi:hypothetical protein